MRQAIMPNLQAPFPFLASLPNLMSFLSPQTTASTLDPSLLSFFQNSKPGFEKAIVTQEKNSQKTQFEQDSIAEIKKEEFSIKKEENGLSSVKENQGVDLANEGRLTIWLEMMRQFKMVNNPLLDYSIMHGFFLQQANFLKEINTYTANLQLFQKNSDSSLNFKSLPTKKTEKISGIYSKEQRLLKIQYYKEKKQKWRLNHPINRGFIGRKMVAKAKPRIRGKFVKKAVFDDFTVKV